MSFALIRGKTKIEFPVPTCVRERRVAFIQINCYIINMKMKKLVLLIGIGSLLLFAACASKPKAKGREFSSHAPLGLVMVVSNQDVNWVGEVTFQNQNSVVSDFVRNTLGLKKDEALVRFTLADDLVNDADSILRKALTDAGVFRLVDKDTMLASINTVMAKKKSAKAPTNQIAAQGYRYIYYKDKQIAADLTREAGVKSLLYVTFEFNKEMLSGFAKTGKARSRVLMDAALVDSAGKVLYHDQIETFSSDRITITSGAYAESELIDLVKEAIGEACYRFVWDFNGTSHLVPTIGQS